MKKHTVPRRSRMSAAGTTPRQQWTHSCQQQRSPTPPPLKPQYLWHLPTPQLTQNLPSLQPIQRLAGPQPTQHLPSPQPTQHLQRQQPSHLLVTLTSQMLQPLHRQQCWMASHTSPASLGHLAQHVRCGL